MTFLAPIPLVCLSQVHAQDVIDVSFSTGMLMTAMAPLLIYICDLGAVHTSCPPAWNAGHRFVSSVSPTISEVRAPPFLIREDIENVEIGWGVLERQWEVWWGVSLDYGRQSCRGEP